MRKILEELRASLDLNNVKREDRGEMTNLLIAEAVGNALSMPSSPVENPISHFRLHHREMVMDTLSQINEQHVIDIDAVATIVFKLWTMRYRMVHKPGHATTKRLLGAMVRDGGFEIPPGLAKLANQYPGVQANCYLIDATKHSVGEHDDSPE